MLRTWDKEKNQPIVLRVTCASTVPPESIYPLARGKTTWYTAVKKQ